MKKSMWLIVLLLAGGCSFISKAAREAGKYIPEEVFLIKILLNQGEKINYHVQSLTTNTMEVQGRSQSVDVRTDMDVSMLVKKVEGDILDLSFTIEKAEGTISSPQGISPIPGLDKFVGKSIDIRLKNNGDVISVGKIEGVEGASDIARQFAELFLFIPERSVKVGEVWKKSEDIDGSKGDYTFILKKVKMVGDRKIGIVDEKGILSIDKTQEMMGMNADVHLKGKEKSTISVSLEKGIPVEKKVETGLEGTSTISGGSLPGSMDIKFYIDNTLTIKMK